MNTLKQAVKSAFRFAGLKVEKRDLLEEFIPPSYHRSQFVPKVYRQTIGLVPYFADMLERVSAVDGDVVECGVSLGHGLLILILLDTTAGRERLFYGFDSFEGFPACTKQDQTANGSYKVSVGDYASPPEVVLRTLTDARVPTSFIDRNVRLVKGFFDKTLQSYAGSIALLHLDCDLYQSYKTCLEQLYDKVAPGGIIMFDEYQDIDFPGSTKALDEFFEDKSEKIQHYSRYGYRKHFAVKQ